MPVTAIIVTGTTNREKILSSKKVNTPRSSSFTISRPANVTMSADPRKALYGDMDIVFAGLVMSRTCASRNFEGKIGPQRAPSHRRQTGNNATSNWPASL